MSFACQLKLLRAAPAWYVPYLLDRAVAERQIAPVDTASVAHVLGGLGREFARPDVAEVAQASPKATADAISELILQGLLAER